MVKYLPSSPFVRRLHYIEKIAKCSGFLLLIDISRLGRKRCSTFWVKVKVCPSSSVPVSHGWTRCSHVPVLSVGEAGTAAMLAIPKSLTWRGQDLPALPWLPPQECLRSPDFSQLLRKVAFSPSEHSSLLVAGTARDKCGAWSLPGHSSTRELNKWRTSYLPSLPKSAFLPSSTKMWSLHSLRLSWTTPSRKGKVLQFSPFPLPHCCGLLGRVEEKCVSGKQGVKLWCTLRGFSESAFVEAEQK